MLTTDTARSATTRTLLAAAVSALVLGSALSGLALVLEGGAASRGALVGTLLVVGVIAFGAFSVNVVARVLPGASLISALVTYGAQMATTLLALVQLNRSGLLDDGTLARAWLAAAIILSSLTWVVAQIVVTARLRIPVYDLPEAGAG